MSEITEKQTRQAQLEAELEKERENGNIDPNKIRELTDSINLLANQIAELEDRQQDEQVREQQFAEHIDGLQLQIQDADPFGKMFPRGQFEPLFGLTEYGEMQKGLHEFIYGLLTDQQTELFNKNKYDLAQKDIAISGLKDQLRAGEDRETQLKRQNSELQDTISKKEIVLQDTERRADAAEELAEQYRKEVELAKSEVTGLLQKVADLQSQLEAAQKPKEAPTSQTMESRLSSLKPATNWADKANKALERWGIEPLTVPTFAPAATESPFRDEAQADPTANVRDSGVSAAEAAKGVTFPAQGDGATEHGLDQHATVQAHVGASVEERITHLERRVAALEANHDAAVA